MKPETSVTEVKLKQPRWFIMHAVIIVGISDINMVCVATVFPLVYLSCVSWLFNEMTYEDFREDSSFNLMQTALVFQGRSFCCPVFPVV